MVKNYGGNDFVQRYVFKWARNKPNEDAHRQVSGSVFHSPIEKSIGQMCKGFVLFIVIMWNAKHIMSRFAAPSMIYAPIRLHVTFQISRIFIFVYFISD